MNNAKENPDNSISSNQNSNGWLLVGCGLLLLIAGGVFAYLATNKINPDHRYGALLIPLTFVGLVLIMFGLKIVWTYQKFGATPLVLDPAVPGVGGQLGGAIHLHTEGVNTNNVSNFRAVLTCTHSRQYGKERKDKIRWQEDAPIHWQYNADGAIALFIFELPEHCWPSKEWSENSSVSWTLRVKGRFETLGKFERSWDVKVEKIAATANTEVRANAA